jgi:N-acetylmuramoyl-L-alanine amidase
MRVRVANKRKFAFWCCIFIIIIFNLIFAVGKRIAGDFFVRDSVQLSVTKGYKVLAADSSGSISFEENSYFKRYVIDCKDDISAVRWEESKEYIDINLKKGNVANLKIKADKGTEIKDIFADEKKEDLTIRLKKNFNDNNKVYVDKADSKKLVILISKVESPFHHKVVIDAGHGGVDVGTSYEDLLEKDINLSISQYAEKELLYNGFNVVMTRDEDEFLQLAEIGNIANNADADAFISVHINSFKESQYNGVSTYYYDPKGYQADERLRLANIMQEELLKRDEWVDRGIFKENFQVLSESKIPCVLLECGFITNLGDREKLANETVLRNFGLSITKGLLSYFNVSTN